MTYRSDKLPPPPKTENFHELYRWNYRIFELLNGIQKILATGIEITPSGSITGTNVQTATDQVVASMDGHHAQHENGGSDEMSVAGLSGELADQQNPKTHATSHATAGSDPVSPSDIGAAPSSQGVTNGNSHDHSGGDGAQIDHAGLANLTTGDPHTQYQKESEKDAANGYAGLSAASRTAKGIDTTDDLIVDLATKGLVLKNDADGHYYRLTIVSGTASWADLGASKP